MSRRGFRVVVAGLSIVAWAGTATAWAAEEEAAPPESPPPSFVAPPPGYEPPQQFAPPGAAPAPVEEDVLPGFMTLDRMDAHTRLGIQIGFNKVDAQSLSDAFYMRFNPYGQYVFPGKQAGIYAQLPISHGFVNGADSTGYGNLEMGGFYLPMSSSDVILRAGIMASTASDNDLGKLVANVSSAYERLTDFLLIAPNYTVMRLSASTVQQVGQGFFRADGGFDLVIDKPSASTSPSVFFRANVAAGIRLPGVDLAFELVNLAALNGTVSGDVTNRFLHTAAVGARTTGENQLHIGSVFPLDSDIRGEIWILSIGYQRAMN